MHVRTQLVLLVCFLAGVGCSKQKSTSEMLEDLKSSPERERIVAVRTLPRRKDGAQQVVPGLIEALKDKSAEVRWGAAIGLGGFGEQARDAIAALQEAKGDRDPRVREAVSVALSRIDPAKFPASSESPGK